MRLQHPSVTDSAADVAPAIDVTVEAAVPVASLDTLDHRWWEVPTRFSAGWQPLLKEIRKKAQGPRCAHPAG